MTLPFSDLRHHLINAMAESLRHDADCLLKKERLRLREQLEETFGKLWLQSKPRQLSLPDSSMRSKPTQRLPRSRRG
jgi:hypothetical protein